MEEGKSHKIFKGMPWRVGAISAERSGDMGNLAVGFNFATLSASHGGVKNMQKLDGDVGDPPVWATPVPLLNCPDYQSSHVASLTRVAIRVGLYKTTGEGKRFSNYAALGQWLHMNATAISLETSVALTLNNIPTVEWSGWQVSSELTDRTAEMEHLVSHGTAGIRVWGQIQAIRMFATTQVFNHVSDYYAIPNLFDSKDWYSYSPVPIHMWHQWVEKRHGALSTNETPQIVTTSISNQTKRALKVTRNDTYSGIKSMASLDIARYLPMALSREGDDMLRPGFVMWVNPQSAMCAITTRRINIPDYSFLSTQVPNFRTVTQFGGYEEDRSVYVIDSNQMFTDAKTHAINVSAIQYPDPPGMTGNDKAPLQPVPEIATTPDTAAMDAVQSRITAPGTSE